MLGHFSNQELTLKLRALVLEERKITRQILELINESARRRLFSEAGYSSLFDWLTRELGYSEGAAQRRIESARLLRSIPEVAEKIESGRLSLTNLAKIGSTLRRVKSSELRCEKKSFSATAMELVRLVEGKSSRAAEAAIAERFPELPKPETVRAVNSENIHAQITLTKTQHAKLERVREIAAHHGATLAELIEIAADEFLKRRDPLLREVKAREVKPRGVKAQDKKLANAKLPESNKSCGFTAGAGGDLRKSFAPSVRKPLAPSVRNLVYRRAKGVCEFQNPLTGRRCDARVQLEVDHIKPLALGGTNSLENLRITCRAHNLFEATRWLGTEKMNRYRSETPA